MQLRNKSNPWPWTLTVLLTLALSAPTWATTLERVSLESLVQDNAIILVGEVTDSHSYWNDDHTIILTDLTLRSERVLKGTADKNQQTVTVMGGTVGDLTNVIVAGAQLVPGNSYLLFLDEVELPGKRALTVREHSQGVFDISLSESGELRVISQASQHTLAQDASGRTDPPGGKNGLMQDDIFDAITTLVAQGDK